MISKTSYLAVMAAMAFGSGCVSETNPNQAPNAVITAPSSITVGQTVSFSGEKSTDPDGDTLAFTWNFDDSASVVPGIAPTHTFTEAGSHTVRLTVNDGAAISYTSMTVDVAAADNSSGDDDSTDDGPSGTGGDSNTDDDSNNDGSNDDGSNDGDSNDDGSNDDDSNDDDSNDDDSNDDDSNDDDSNDGNTDNDDSNNDDSNNDDSNDGNTDNDSDDDTDDSSDDGDSNTTPVARVDNPFADATWYVNKDWSNLAASVPGGSAIADQSTAVWLDNIAAINGVDGKMGLRGHLNQALAQGADLITVVVYDLPGRDCAANASNGELPATEAGLSTYKSEFIDPISEILSDSTYQSLRIAVLLEIDSLPNLITNMDKQSCDSAAPFYRRGTKYALNKLTKIDNVYTYLDIAHSGWLGWSNNLGPAADLFTQIITDTDKGWDSVAGFISNVSNYTPTVEPYLNVSAVRSDGFYKYNDYIDEKSYVMAFRQQLLQRQAPSTIGMLIDTSRNGWGGSQRPTCGTGSSDVANCRVDRRQHRGNWCNQPGGIGYKPFANPYGAYAGVDAFVWAKPPGESDGIAVSGVSDPSDPAKQYDTMCDPYQLSNEQGSNGAIYTGAMPDAPHAGRWFPAGLQTLLNNAYPPLNTPAGQIVD